MPPAIDGVTTGAANGVPTEAGTMWTVPGLATDQGGPTEPGAWQIIVAGRGGCRGGRC